MRLAAIGLLVCGCNQILDIDKTHEILTDTDLDGIPDPDDNCPDVANPDQADADHDGLGDVCDPCPNGPQSGQDTDGDGKDDLCDPCPTGGDDDEDADGFLDGCDVCPGIAEPDQRDADGDGVGDACDPDPSTPQHRVAFDGFEALADTWTPRTVAWHAIDGAAVPDGPPAQSDFGLWSRTLAVTGDHWQVEARFALPAAPPLTTEVGLVLTDDVGMPVYYCYVVFDASSTWKIYGNVGVSLASEVVVRMNAAGSDVACTIGGTRVVAGMASPGQHLHPSLFVTQAIAPFEYVDLIE